MFRVSPWISYDPNAENHGDSSARQSKMNEDVDMDAPQISTLPEEQTPEPQPSPSRTSKFRVKLVMSDPKRTASVAGTSSRKASERGASGDDDDDDEEEDQLIDDDDDEAAKPPPPPVVSAPPPVSTRGTATKRGTGVGRGRGRGRGRGGKLPRTDAPLAIAPGPSSEGIATITIPPTSVSAPVPPVKKTRGVAKASTRGTRGKRSRGGIAKAAIPSHLRDDGGSESMSVFPVPHIVPYVHDTSAYAPTAASTPPHDEPTPEIHEAPLPPPTIPIAPAPPTEEINLEGVAVPTYPLPTKPFPVQPPPKIGAAFAPALQLDRSGKHARHWRQANREIRGVAGGRWFTKAWIGDKESEYAAYLAAGADKANSHSVAEREVLMTSGSVPIPRLPGTSTRGRPRAFKADSHLGTNPSSRAHSTGADSISASTSKKRANPQAAADPPLTISAPAPA